MEYVAEVVIQLSVFHETAHKNLNIYSSMIKIKYDLAATEIKYNVGNNVLLFCTPKENSGSLSEAGKDMEWCLVGGEGSKQCRIPNSKIPKKVVHLSRLLWGYRLTDTLREE